MGRNLAHLFRKNGYNVHAPSKTELDLLHEPLQPLIDNIKPDIVVHAAIKGGTVVDKDDLYDVLYNVKMFDRLMAAIHPSTTVFVIGSGAEFNRAQDIDCFIEDDVARSFPTDPYGMAKNIISRKALYEFDNTYIVRLFGCFNHDEEDFRFIKRCILNLKEDKPVVIHQDRMMDFFYMDDVFTVLDYLIKEGGPRHMNLVYKDKHSLMEIASMIMTATKKQDKMITLENLHMGHAYTGDSAVLDTLGLKFIGLEEGIVRTCKKLL